MLKLCRTFIVIIFLYITGTGNTLAYGNHFYGFGYQGYGYGHYGFGAHYSSHGDIGTAGYVIIGLLGAVLISSILNDNERYQGSYYRSNPYPSPVPYKPVVRPVQKTQSYSYHSNEGWDALLTGNSRHALDVFAVQTQQNLNSGIPRIGFSLSAAANGELDRGLRAMQKAIHIDPDSLDQIQSDRKLVLMVDLIIEDYSSVNSTAISDPERSFMIAALSYLKGDYQTARDFIPEQDQNQSTINLKNLIDHAL